MVDEPQSPPRIALAHDWICGFRGGEAVLEEIAAMAGASFDAGPLYVMFDDGETLAPTVDRLEHVPSFLSRFPSAMRRWLLPLYPAGVAQLSSKLSRRPAHDPIDLLVSTSSAAIKGLRPPSGVPHLCYCHAPARYVWTIQDEYAGSLAAIALRAYAPFFRSWDARTAANVTRFIANSAYTAAQIKRCFDRDAGVVYPPVDIDRLPCPDNPSRTDDWLVVSALEPYKRVDLAIEAANRARHKLHVIGSGSQRDRLRALAGDTVHFHGRVDHDELVRHFQTARLLIHPQIEDFGITAVEAQSCGLPILARRAGGAIETVIEGETGAFFDDATPQAILDAIDGVPGSVDQACHDNAARFSTAQFHSAMRKHVTDLLGSI